MHDQRKRYFATAVAVCTLVSACASSGGPADKPSPVSTAVEAWPSGVSLMFTQIDGQTTLVSEVQDYTGTRERLSWPAAPVKGTPAYSQFASCVERVRAATKRPEKRWFTHPYFLRIAIHRCIETTGMPAPEVTAEPNATEYRMSILVGSFGERRRLRLASPSPTPVNSDVDQCMDRAVNRGVVTKTTLTFGDSAGYRQQMTSTSIVPLLERFDSCMRKRSYLVDEPPKSEPKWSLRED